MNLKVLDISWNSIGTFKGKVFAYALADILGRQESIMHLDISFNKIGVEDCHVIANGLAVNHSLWGLHMAGNEGYVDAKGFLHPGEKDPKDESVGGEHLEQRVNGTQMILSNAEREAAKLKRINNCWICEGWGETKIEWPERRGTEPVFLHLECDYYQSDLMISDPEDNGYSLWRMLPPGRTKFFFTVEGKATISEKYPTVPCSIKQKVNYLLSLVG